MKKLILKALLFLSIILPANSWGQLATNKNFNSRFEYVISVFEHITDYEEDVPLSLILVVDGKNPRPVYIGIKAAYYTLYGKKFETKDQLYFSVGKVFLCDTLNITQARLDLFKNYLVDTAELKRISSRKFEKNLSECCEKNGFRKESSRKVVDAMSYYFDRRFYPTREIHNGSSVTDFEYGFSKSNLIQISRGKEIYNQTYDQRGTLINEEDGFPDR